MKKSILIILSACFIALSSFTTSDDKLVNKNGYINFFSHTVAEDISSDNYKVTSTLDRQTGDVAYSVPMQSFEFEKALMQKHFNSDKFLDTRQFPKAKFAGKITNLDEINFSMDGTYKANVDGDLTIKDVTKPISESGTITVKGSKITVDAKMQVTLANYEIAFKEGKPSTNVAKVIDVTIKSEYEK